MDNKKKCEYHKIREGLAIRKVPQSKNWNVYLKLPNHKALQFSLRTADFEEAIEKANEEYYVNKILLERGEKIRQPKQRLTASQVIDELIREHEKAQEKTKIKGRDGKNDTKIRLFKKIKEFYGDTLKPSDLDNPKVREYFQANQPFSNTQLISTRYCFNQVFDRSFEKKLIKKDQIIDLNKIKVEKKTEERRDFFTYSEFSKVTMHGLKSCKEAHGKGKHTQKMLILYASFLFHSGVRAGFEALGIKWSDLNYTSFGDLYCTIKDGKTKNYKKNNRNVIFDYFAEETILDVAKEKYKDVLKGKTTKEIIEYLINNKPNDKIFSSLYGDNPNYQRIFKRWIDDLKALKILSNSKDLTLYSLRHSYITRAIENDVPMSLIAENAGTSATMIEKHYSHITVMTERARKTLLRDKILFENGDFEEIEETHDTGKKQVIRGLIESFGE